MNRTRELEKLRTRYERLRRLYEVSNVIHSTLEPKAALKLILRQAVRLTRATSGSVVLVNPNTGFLEIQASYGLPAHATDLRLRVGEGVTGWVARTGEPLRIGDVRKHRRYIMVRPKARSELAVPMEVNDRVGGVINVDSDREDAFDAGDQELLEGLAVQASKVIQNTWVYEQIRLKAQLLESLLSVSQTLNSALNLEEALTVVTREARDLMEAKLSSVLLLDPTGRWLELRAFTGAGPAYAAGSRLSVDDSLLGSVVRRRAAVQVPDVQRSGRYQRVQVARQEGLVSLLSIPLIYRGTALGVLNVYSGMPYRFSDEQIRIMTGFAELSGIAIEKARLYERILTVEDELRRSEKLSVLGLLSAELAHEIRNPLTVIKMLFHSLDLQFPVTDPRHRDAVVIQEKMDHLNRIVERALDFARGDEPRRAPVPINDIIEDLGLLVRPKLRHQGIEYRARLARDVPAFPGDATQVEQVVFNLTLNAIEAMPDGGRLTLQTRTGTSPDGVDYIQFAVSDTGPGMTARQQKEAFTSLLNTTKPGGVGLGLAIVRRVVESHRGRILVRSRVGRGTTVTVRFPVEDDAVLS